MYSKNIDLISYHDLKKKPAFQMALQVVDDRYYLYLASFRHSGWAIIEVTDPEHPRYIRWIDGPEYEGQGCPKIQVADGIMITALGGSLPMLHGTNWDDPYIEGLYIWDVKDPENPKKLSYWSTGDPKGMGVHRFGYNGGRYVHLSASCPGFTNMIYRVLDIQDPANPVEIGRWWLPEQWGAGTIDAENGKHGELSMLDLPGMHGPAYIKDHYAYLSYGGAGMIILDISDITLPKLTGQLKHTPPISGGFSGARCHTVLPLSHRNYAVMTSEGERFACFNKDIIGDCAQPINFLGMVDISNPTNPTLVSIFPYPEVPKNYPYPDFNDCGIGAPGPFGPHNIHEPMGKLGLEDRNDRIYCCYFHAGMRIYDISNPFIPKEIAYFIPPIPDQWLFPNQYPGPRLGTAEDVVVDDRGYIYMDTFHDGLYILKCTV